MAAPSFSLKPLALLGFGWNSASTLVIQGLALLRITLVARWLGPDEIGIYGLALASLAAFALLRQFGLLPAYISLSPKAAGENDDWLQTVWWLNLFFCLAVTAVTAGLAYPTSWLLDDSRLFLPLIVLSCAPTLSAFTSPTIFALEKQANFRPIAVLETAKALVLTAMVLVLAWQLQSVWALIWGNLLAEAVGAIMSYTIAGKRPQLKFSRSIANQVLSFGKHVLVAAVLTYATSQADDVVVGALLGTEVLGIYYLAYRFAMFPVGLMGSIVSRTITPIYRVAADGSMLRLKTAWLQIFSVIPWALAGLLLPLALFADNIISLLVGTDWQAAAPIVVLLSVTAAFRGLAHGISPLLIVLRHPDIEARYKLIEAVVFLPCLFAGIATLGLTGAAIATALSYGIAFILRLIWVLRRFELPFVKLFRQALAFPLLVVGLLTLMWLLNFAEMRSAIIGIPVVILVCAMCMGATVLRRKQSSGQT